MMNVKVCSGPNRDRAIEDRESEDIVPKKKRRKTCHVQEEQRNNETSVPVSMFVHADIFYQWSQGNVLASRSEVCRFIPG